MAEAQIGLELWLFAVALGTSMLGGLLGMASGIFIVPILTGLAASLILNEPVTTRLVVATLCIASGVWLTVAPAWHRMAVTGRGAADLAGKPAADGP